MFLATATAHLLLIILSPSSTQSFSNHVRRNLACDSWKSLHFDLGLKRSRLYAIGDNDDIEYQEKLSSKDNDYSQENNVSDSFDGKGFLTYLAPYSLAFIFSIGITAAFVKFVLLDY